MQGHIVSKVLSFSVSNTHGQTRVSLVQNAQFSSLAKINVLGCRNLQSKVNVVSCSTYGIFLKKVIVLVARHYFSRD